MTNPVALQEPAEEEDIGITEENSEDITAFTTVPPLVWCLTVP